MSSTQCASCWKIPCVCFRQSSPGRLSDYELRQLSNDELTELLVSASKILKDRLTVVRTSSNTTSISMHNLRPNSGESTLPEEQKNA